MATSIQTSTPQSEKIEALISLYDAYDETRTAYYTSAVKCSECATRLLNHRELPSDQEDLDRFSTLRDASYDQAAELAPLILKNIKIYLQNDDSKEALAEARFPGDISAQNAFIAQLRTIEEQGSLPETGRIRLINVKELSKAMNS